MWLNHYRAKVVSCDENAGEVVATHDGYRAEGVSHTRRVQFDRDANEFTITDTLRCEKPATVEIPFHLYPAVEYELQGSEALLKIAGVAKVRMCLDEKLHYAIRTDGWYSEHFGEKVPSRFLYAKKECEGEVEFVTRIRVLKDIT